MMHITMLIKARMKVPMRVVDMQQQRVIACMTSNTSGYVRLRKL